MALQVYNSDEKTPVQYENRVIAKRERNSYHDSDFYAIVWSDELEQPICVDYHTTRGASTGWADIDATDEVLEKYNLYNKTVKEFYKEYDALEKSLENLKGDIVNINRGKHSGQSGQIFWIGTCNFSGKKKLGIATSNEKNEKGGFKDVVWVLDEYCQKQNYSEIKQKLDNMVLLNPFTNKPIK